MRNLTEELKQRGLWNNSVLLFLSDNGGTYEHGAPVPGSSNYPLRGHKYTYFEGGVRSSSFVASPLLPAAVRGTTSRALLSVADWWATFAALAGLAPTDPCEGCVPVDGRDAWPVLSGAPGAAAAWRTELLLGVGGRGMAGAYRNGSHKLIAVGGNAAGDEKGCWSAQYPGSTAVAHEGAPGAPDGPCGTADGTAGVCLFDLTADPRETNNLAASEPALAAALLGRYQELARAAYAPNGHEEAAREAGLPAAPTDCADDACWSQPVAAAAGGAADGGGVGGGDGGGGDSGGCSVASAAAVGGDWIDGADVFTFTVSAAAGNASSAAVAMTVARAGPGIAFTRAAGTLALDPASGAPASIELVQSGKGVWVRHAGAFREGGCEIVWDGAGCNATAHHWAPFCKSGASCSAKSPTPPPAPPPPLSAACVKMLETGFWAPWVV